MRLMCVVLVVLLFAAVVTAALLHGFNMQYAVDGIRFKSAECRAVEAELMDMLEQEDK